MLKKFGISVLLMAGLIMTGACSSKGKSMKAIEGKDGLFAIMDTSKGEIAIELYYKDAPLTVCNFVGLAEGTLDATDGKAFYDGLKFHRVIADFMIQGGDPRGNGTGGPGYKFADEVVPYTFDKPGYLAMANSGPNTNGSQFFITHVPTGWLNGKHTIFGHVVSEEDQKVVNAVEQGDLIKSVKIVRNGAEAEAFKCTQADWNKLNAESAARMAEMRKKAIAEAANKFESQNKSKVDEVVKKFPGYTKSDEGIFWKTVKEGSGEKCGAGKYVAVAYKGYLVDGTVFDSSEGRGDLEFGTDGGQMIPGFDIMVQDMKKGEKRTMVIPPFLAYGDQGYPGVIPPKSYIVFDVTLNRF